MRVVIGIISILLYFAAPAGAQNGTRTFDQKRIGKLIDEQEARESAGKTAALSQTELSPMRERLAALWHIRPGAPRPEELVVVVRIKLSPAGRLTSPPEIISSGASNRYLSAANAAVQAVIQGQPYDMLKPETYNQWKNMDITFDPRQMFQPDRQAGVPPPEPTHKKNYVSVEADNGAVIKVDMNSIQRGNGAIVFTYADEGNPDVDPYNLQGYEFDCQGHYSLMGLHSSPMLYAPPRSVVAQISALACSVPIGTMPK